jgi:C6 transcription factor Pro1
MTLLDFSHGPAAALRQLAIELDDNDQRLLDHFFEFVLPSTFPILETNKPGSARTDLIVPALVNNKRYLQCCLSISAQHYKTSMNVQGEQIVNDIMRHRYAAISINDNDDYQQILEARLAMIFFQCSVSRIDDSPQKFHGLSTLIW